MLHDKNRASNHMKTIACSLATMTLALFGLAPSARADALLANKPAQKVQPAVSLQLYAFPLSDVRLLDGPFKHARELDEAYLLSLDVDRLLHNFRVNAGLPSTAEPLGGWEAPGCELRGHFVGHYLSACALMYASTGHRRFKDKGDAVVAGLAECQARFTNGYLSAFPETFIDRVEKPSQVWAPYYTLHKVLAGLLEMHACGGNGQALEAARKFGDWVEARNARLTDAQMQRMLENEHGGMNESLAELYAVTGDPKYLRASLRFNHHKVLDPAAGHQDKLTGLHANTQIPKFIGNARQYELTGDSSLNNAARFFWDTVVNERSYVIGGNSDGEHFSPKEHLSQALGPNTTETCNTYNMLKLTRHLFCWDPQEAYAEYYERALYNQILCSQNPETGMMCYYVPLRSGSHKSYNGRTDAFWCCTGTGIENHAKYTDSIYFHNDQALYVNLFIASELDWKAKGLTLKQETDFPDQSTSRLTFNCKERVKLELKLRHPFWATSGFEVRVNGKIIREETSRPGSWVALKRTWKNGDTVEISMPFGLRTEAFKDNPNRFGFLNGPIVLCAGVDLKKPYPAMVAEGADYLAGLKPVVGQPNTFTGPASLFRIPGDEDKQGVTLEPFYRMHGNRSYVVYFDRFTPAQWTLKEQDYLSAIQRDKELEARTIDRVNPGEEQNERDHNLQGERTSAGDAWERKYRHAQNGGWFSWNLKVLPGEPQELVLTYWGGDSGRQFAILADGQNLATERLTASHPDQFFEQGYPLPPDLTQGKTKVTVKVQAAANSMGGGVFGVRMMKTAPSKP
jgi:uncharacterized protein